jgi:hypothetical protein
MSCRDDAAILVALAALLLAGGTWSWRAWTAPAAHVADRAGLERASRQALELEPVDSPVVWRDPDSGTIATITPAPAFLSTDGRWCRAYEVELAATSPDDHQPPGRHHVACRSSGGTWARLPDSPGNRTAVERWFGSRVPVRGDQLADIGG